MKTIHILAAALAALALASCAQLAGTSATYGADGILTITPPATPIVIPTK